MTAVHSERGLQTLAQWLVALWAGDPCPCCGAPLEDDSPSAGERSGLEQGSLVCDHCGFRLESADAFSAQRVCAGFELAA